MKGRLFYLFSGIILVITLLDILSKDKDISEIENRKLQNKPKFKTEDYINGNFKDKYNKYLDDQFVFRDEFITLKGVSEKLLLKKENNGVYFGKDGYLLEKVLEVSDLKIENNIKYINKFIENNNLKTSIMIVPNSFYILRDKLPIKAKEIESKEIIDKIYKEVDKASSIDLIKPLEDKKDDYIFYKTDHHWTTLGAFIGYKEYLNSLGKEAITLENFKEEKEFNFLGSYFSKSKNIFIEPDIISYYDFNNLEIFIDGVKKESLIDRDYFKGRDKYSAFLSSNNKLTKIINKDLKTNEKLLVIKDSYGNSLVPFLTQSFKEVHVVDLRYFDESIKSYIKENNISECLIIYNLINFTRDTSVVKLIY